MKDLGVLESIPHLICQLFNGWSEGDAFCPLGKAYLIAYQLNPTSQQKLLFEQHLKECWQCKTTGERRREADRRIV